MASIQTPPPGHGSSDEVCAAPSRVRLRPLAVLGRPLYDVTTKNLSTPLVRSQSAGLLLSTSPLRRSGVTGNSAARGLTAAPALSARSEEHTSELQSLRHL